MRPHPRKKYPGDAAIRSKKGAWVAALQVALRCRGYSVVQSGKWDAATVAAVTRFQAKHPACGKPDGVPGAKTWGAIFPAQATMFPGVEAIKKRTNGKPAQWLKNLQQTLKNRGYTSVIVHGKWNAATKAAVRSFQANHPAACGTPDGIPGAKTWAALFGADSIQGGEGGWKWITKRDGVTWPDGSDGKALLTRLDKVGQRTGRRILLYSGKRTQQQQHDLYMLYLDGRGNLAASCGANYKHSWSNCPQACSSNHCRSKAVDCGVLDKNGNPTDIGNFGPARDAMKAEGLCLPVGGEKWHVEIGNNWRS